MIDADRGFRTAIGGLQEDYEQSLPDDSISLRCDTHTYTYTDTHRHTDTHTDTHTHTQTDTHTHPPAHTHRHTHTQTHTHTPAHTHNQHTSESDTSALISTVPARFEVSLVSLTQTEQRRKTPG